MIDFILRIAGELLASGAKLELVPSESVDCNGLPCDGLWDDEEKTLSVAINKEEWYLILAHEFGHFQQWKNEEFGQETNDKMVLFDEWINRTTELSNYALLDVIRSIQRCERDAESKASKLIIEYNLGITPEEYNKQANAYIYLYEFIRINRRWPEKGPSKFKEILDIMPSHLISEDEMCVLPTGYSELVEKYCFKKEDNKCKDQLKNSEKIFISIEKKLNQFFAGILKIFTTKR